MHILCADCDGSLGKYEDYAAKLFDFNSSTFNGKVSVKQYVDKRGDPYERVSDFDYANYVSVTSYGEADI